MTDKNTVYLTEEGLSELKKELDDLINIKRPENIQAIKEARSLGDLSENADYDLLIRLVLEIPLQLNMLMMMKRMSIKLLVVKRLIRLKVRFQMKVQLLKLYLIIRLVTL